jgi:hypothetical protein
MMPLSEFLDQGRLRSSVHEDVLTTVSGGNWCICLILGPKPSRLR